MMAGSVPAARGEGTSPDITAALFLAVVILTVGSGYRLFFQEVKRDWKGILHFCVAL
jgi:hypothetical protein